MQRPKQEGLGAAFGGGVTDQVFGARTTNVLQKGTVYLGSMFFILSLTLAILIGKQTQQRTLVDSDKPVAEEKAVAEEEENEEVVAEVEAPKSIADELESESVPATSESVPAEDAVNEASAEENKADKSE